MDERRTQLIAEAWHTREQNQGAENGGPRHGRFILVLGPAGPDAQMGWLTIVELHRSVPFPGHVVIAAVVVVAVIDSLAWRIKADGQVRLGPFDRNECAKDVRRLDTLDEVLAAVAPRRG